MNKANIAYLVTGVASSMALASPALACDAEFDQSSRTVTLTAVEVGNGLSVRENFQIRLRNASDASCSTSLRFSRLSTSLPDDAFSYQLASGGQRIDILPAEVSAPSTGSDLFVPGTAGTGSNERAVPLQISLPAEWGVGSGSLNEQLLVQLVDTNGDVLDTMTLFINLQILPAVEMRIVGATGVGRVAQIDLGALDPQATNRSEPFGVRIWSTDPYSVTFASTNLGSLVHDTASDRISYRLLVDGRRADLSGAQPGTFGQRTGSLGNLHPLEIIVAPFTAQAGDYSDRVTVTVTAS